MLTLLLTLAAADGANAATPQPAYPPALVQPADDPPTRFEPLVPRDGPTDSRVDAMAYFMQGQIQERRRELPQALASYEQALKKDDRSLQIYASYVPLAYLLGESDNAVAAAQKVTSLHDTGHQLLRALAAVMATTGQGDEATVLLLKGLNEPRVRDSRIASLLVRRDLGAIYKLLGQVPEAAQQFKRVFEALTDEAAPLSEEDRTELLADAGETYETMGIAFLENSQPDLAVAAFDKAGDFQKMRPEVRSYNLATVFERTGQPEKALTELDRYLRAQLQSKGTAAYELLAKLYKQLDREDELLPRLGELVEADRRNPSLRYFYASRLLRADRLDEAEEQYGRALGGGSDPRGLVGMMGVYRRRGDAEKLFDLLLRLYPALPQIEDPADLEKAAANVREVVTNYNAELKAMTESGDLMDRIAEIGRTKIQGNRPDLDFLGSYVLGRVMIDAERTDDALAFYKAALKLRPDQPTKFYQELFDHLMSEARYAEAADLMAEAAESESPRVRAEKPLFYYWLAHSRELSGDTDGALDAIRQAREGQPDNAALWFEEAWIYYHARRLDEAAAMFIALIDAHEGNPASERFVQNSQFSLSNIYVLQKDRVRGVAILEKILAADPTNTQANNDLGYLWAEDGINLERAKKMIALALAAEPDNPAYMDSMGWVLHQLGDSAAALPLLERSSGTETGQDAVIFEHLGEVYRALGREADARAAFERGLELEREKPQPDEEIIQRLEESLAE